VPLFHAIVVGSDLVGLFSLFLLFGATAMRLARLTIASILVTSAFSGAASAKLLIGGDVGNGNFESPDVGAATNFNTGSISNWSNWTEVDTADSDTGVYDSGAAGSQIAYIQPGGAIVNMTSHIIAVGESFSYGFTDIDALRGDAIMQLVFNSAGVLTAIPGTALVGNGTISGDVYSNTFAVLSGTDPWVGSVIGVGLSTTGNYPEVDNITLDVTPVAVPEPGTLALLGLSGLLIARRRRA
jgi:hypothetical protein